VNPTEAKSGRKLIYADVLGLTLTCREAESKVAAKRFLISCVKEFNTFLKKGKKLDMKEISGVKHKDAMKLSIRKNKGNQRSFRCEY